MDKESSLRVHIEDLIKEWADKCEDLEMLKNDADLRAERYSKERLDMKQ